MDPENNQVSNPEIDNLIEKNYEYGFTTDIESETIAPGLNEDVIRLISKKKDEPQFLLDWRLKAFRHWSKLKEPEWGHLNIDKINYQNISYFSAPKL